MRTTSRYRWLVPAALLGLPGPAPGQDTGAHSPTQMDYTLPAWSRGAGWTLGAAGTRQGLFARNPVFLAAPLQSKSLDLTLELQYKRRDADVEANPYLDQFEASTQHFGSFSCEIRTAHFGFGLSYQQPYAASFAWSAPLYLTPVPRSASQRIPGVSLSLRSLHVASAGEFSGFSFGAAFSYLQSHFQGDASMYPVDNESDWTHLALGCAFESRLGALAVAYRSSPDTQGDPSGPRGGPPWLLFDGWAPVGPVELSVQAGVGDDETVETLLDWGWGVRWQVHPRWTLLGGMHHLSSREDAAGSPGLLDQGLFLDVGLLAKVGPVALAMALEDSHASDAEFGSTFLTFSMSVSYDLKKQARSR